MHGINTSSHQEKLQRHKEYFKQNGTYSEAYTDVSSSPDTISANILSHTKMIILLSYEHTPQEFFTSIHHRLLPTKYMHSKSKKS